MIAAHKGIALCKFDNESKNFMIKPWPKIVSKPMGDYRVFSVRSDLKISPRTGAQHDFFVIDSTTWVNVIAITPDRQMVLVEQYRHGSDTIELEIPGGVMDAGDSSSVATGIRELREETGYEGENAQVIGTVLANAAIMSNSCYTILIENCRHVAPVHFDSAEDIATRLVPMENVPDLVAQGKIRHSIVVAALYHYDLWKKNNSHKKI